jgi:hypothetical protein
MTTKCVMEVLKVREGWNVSDTMETALATKQGSKVKFSKRGSRKVISGEGNRRWYKLSTFQKMK